MDAPNIADFRTGADVDETFAEAVVHKPCSHPAKWGFYGHKVLGFRLRPFSFWHAANLDFVESPFAGHKKPIDFAALYVACQICRLSYPESLKPAKRGLCRLVRLWKARKYRPIKITRRALRKKRIDRANFPFLAELNKFSAYLRDYASRPDYVSSENSESIKTPWYLYEVCLLRKHNPNLSKSDAWDSVIGEASWDNAGMLEASGIKIEILTPQMRKTFDEIERLTGAY